MVALSRAVALEYPAGSAILDPVFIEPYHLDGVPAVGIRHNDLSRWILQDRGIGIIIISSSSRGAIRCASCATGFDITNPRPGRTAIFGECDRKRFARAGARLTSGGSRIHVVECEYEGVILQRGHLNGRIIVWQMSGGRSGPRASILRSALVDEIRIAASEKPQEPSSPKPYHGFLHQAHRWWNPALSPMLPAV